MKNLYKIEDELYIISNTENINENCWIITDGRLVQVSYLLSDEVAKGNKVILTTNKLLIKDDVQAIDDEFLEWFVKNPSCEEVNIDKINLCTQTGLPCGMQCLSKETCNKNISYKIIIPKEFPKPNIIDNWLEKNGDPEIAKQVELEAAELFANKSTKDRILSETSESTKQKAIDYGNDLAAKQETLEEVAEKLTKDFPHYSVRDNMDDSDIKGWFLEALQQGAKWQQERMYSYEEVLEQLNLLYSMKNSLVDTFTDENDYITMKWFEQFKNK